MRRFLAARGYALRETLAARDAYQALLVTDPAGIPSVLIVRLSDTVALAAEPLPLEPSDPRPSVEWLTLKPNTDALTITFDAPVEGPVATLVFIRERDSFRRTYQDTSAVCRPAEAKDIDRDGQIELIAYGEDPAKGGCMSECHLMLEERFAIQPAWTEVLSWNGTRWQPAGPRFPEFYRALAQQYEKVAHWLSDSTGAETCRQVYWSPTPQLFLDLAKRARANAG